MEKQNCFSSHLPGKEDTDLWLAWLVRSVVATASCPPCALWLPLLSAAAYRDTQSGCGQTRRKQALEQNTKYVLMQTSLIMESKWREMVKKKKDIFLLEGEGTYCTTAKRECERWSLSEFTSLSIKQNSGYFTVTARFSQAVEWQTSLKNKQRNLLMLRFLPSRILSFFFFFFVYFSSTSQIFFITPVSPENSNSCWNDKPFSQVKQLRPCLANACLLKTYCQQGLWLSKLFIIQGHQATFWPSGLGRCFKDAVAVTLLKSLCHSVA